METSPSPAAESSSRRLPPGEDGLDEDDDVSGEEDGGEEITYETMQHEHVRAIVERFTDEQLDRYSCYRRSAFPRDRVRKIMQQVSESKGIPDRTAIAVAGAAKMFVGEIVELALDVQQESLAAARESRREGRKRMREQRAAQQELGVESMDYDEEEGEQKDIDEVDDENAAIPLTPAQIRESYRRLRADGRVMTGQPPPDLFRR